MHFAVIYKPPLIDVIFSCSGITDEIPSREQLYLVLRHHSDLLKPHKDATLPRIPICAFDRNQGPHSMDIEIAGENVAITARFHDDGQAANAKLYVFNWKTGINKIVRQGNYSSGKQYFIFAF